MNNELLNELLPRGRRIADNYRVNQALYFNLNKIQWKIVGCLTGKNNLFKSNSNEGFKFRNRQWLNLIKDVSAGLNISKRQLFYYVRHEIGAGERHLHFLLGEHGIEHICPNLMSDNFKKLWLQNPVAFSTDVQPIKQDLIINSLAYNVKVESRESCEDDFGPYFLSKSLFKYLKATRQVATQINLTSLMERG
jgi:hypothetical protein